MGVKGQHVIPLGAATEAAIRLELNRAATETAMRLERNVAVTEVAMRPPFSKITWCDPGLQVLEDSGGDKGERWDDEC